MDLEDSFTEKLAQRAKARREYVNQKKVDFFSSGKKRAVLIDEHQVNSGEPPKKSPKRLGTQTACQPYDKENVEMEEEESNSLFVPVHSISKNRGLAALKKKNADDGDNDTSSQATCEPQVNKSQQYVFSTNSKELCSGKSSRLANLAANIRQWEDESYKSPLLSDNSASTKFHASSANASTSKNTFSVKFYYTDKLGESKESLNSKPVTPLHSEESMDSFSALKQNNNKSNSVEKSEKFEIWNKAVMTTLETPTSIFIRKNEAKNSNENTEMSTSESCDPQNDEDYSDESINENDFAENYNNIGSNHESNIKTELSYSPFKNTKCNQKFDKITKPEIAERLPPQVTQDAIKANVDPAELPLSARRALFEKALLSGTPKLNENVDDFKLSIAQRAAMFENASKMNNPQKFAKPKEPKYIGSSNLAKLDKTGSAPVRTVQSAKMDSNASPIKKISPVTSALSPTKNVGNHTLYIQQKLMENSGNKWQEKEIASKMTVERKQEISSLVSHWEKLSSSSAENNNSEQERNCLASEENVSDNSDVQETYEQSDEFEDSIDTEDDNVYHKNDNIDTKEKDVGTKENDIDDENDNDCYDEQEDDYVDGNEDAAENVFYSSNTVEVNLRSEEEEERKSFEREPSPYSSKKTGSVLSSLNCSGISSHTDGSHYSASGSQSCASGSSVRSYDITSASDNQEAFENKKEKNPEVPLIYTVSFYRKQKQEARLTPPSRTIVRREKVSSSESSDTTDYTEIIQERIKALQEEILRQQIVISQTSQALNLCSATVEFSGSTEQVEGERLLLIATQKRQACLNEITRLKTFGAQGENIADGKGTMTITDLVLPLKREFIASQLEGKGSDSVHYFLCLIRHGAQVIVTQMMSTDDKTTDGFLSFTNHIQLKNLPPDFSVIFEVYALQTKKEVLPHEKKYHIKKEHSKIRLTPKNKKSDGKIPAISSPGGPNAVRSPSFGVVGYTRFTLQNYNKKTFTLDKVPFTSPLEGILRVKLQLHAELKVTEKGFLTMFEDVSGFGAWHRRWCVLDASHLAFWKYPDDENRKEPIGVINLKQCITKEVKQVAREVCARPYTFQLLTVRPQEKGDKNTLISRSVNTLTTTKHLLSADTKEERILWCNKLNEALTNVRKWDPQALLPIETVQI